jgi:hypothetical protein
MNTNDKELLDLLAKLALSEDEVRETVADIRRGDDLLHHYDRSDRSGIAPGVMLRMESRVRAELAGRGRQPSGNNWSQRAAALAAVLVISLGLSVFWLQKKVINTPGGGQGIAMMDPIGGDMLSEIGLWQMTLVQEDEVDQIDNMVLTEVLHECYQAGFDLDDILGTSIDGAPEPISKPNPISISRGIWIGHLPC